LEDPADRWPGGADYGPTTTPVADTAHGADKGSKPSRIDERNCRELEDDPLFLAQLGDSFPELTDARLVEVSSHVANHACFSFVTTD
jgi:hypothetical protein